MKKLLLLGLFVSITTVKSNAQSLFAPVITSPFGLTDFGMFTDPYLADLDNDGDFDLICGQADDFQYFENIGTITTPLFGTIQTNPFGLVQLPGSRGASSPAMVDLDNDGDLDLLSGSSWGDYVYYENIGTAITPNFTAPVIDPFGLGILSPGSTQVYLIDFDLDGDYDLFSAADDGKVRYYENIGTPSAPLFASPVTNPFGLTDVGAFASIALSDFDLDGDFDAVVGRLDGKGISYINTGTVASPSFTLLGGNKLGMQDAGFYFNPAFADLDNDGDEDLFVGHQGGQIRYHEYGATYADLTVSSCENYDSPSGNYNWNMTGVYQDTIPNLAGLDSIMTIDLTVHTATFGTDIQIACDSYTWIDGNTYTEDNNTATWTLINAAGCDSLITLDLTIMTVDVSVSQSETELTANQSGATYQWLDCDAGNIPIIGETNQSYTATSNGNYSVIVTVGSCSDTSTCKTVTTVGFEKLNQEEKPLFFPNPTNGALNFSSCVKSVSIYQTDGKLVRTYKNVAKIDELGLPIGLYVLIINDKNNHQSTKKLIIN